MKKQKLYNANERYFTMKRGTAEYFNEDCPDIYDNKYNRIFHTDINNVYVEEGYEKIVYKFILNSYKLYCKKYKEEFHELAWLKKIKI